MAAFPSVFQVRPSWIVYPVRLSILSCISQLKSLRKDPERLFSYKNRVDHSSILQSGIIQNWVYLWIYFLSYWMWFDLVYATSSLGSTETILGPRNSTSSAIMSSSATCISKLLKKSDPIKSSKLIPKSNVNPLRYFWSCQRIEFCRIRFGAGVL